MPYETLSFGLTLQIPTAGTKNWANPLKLNAWKKISEHDHTGSGRGNKITSDGLAAESVGSLQLKKNFGVALGDPLIPSGTTQEVDWNTGMVQTVDLTNASGDVTLTFANDVDGGRYTLLLQQASSGQTRNVTLPNYIRWAQGVAPIITRTFSAIDKIELVLTATGYYGDWNNEYYA